MVNLLQVDQDLDSTEHGGSITEGEKVRHIAVLSFSALGDLLVALPFISEIRRIYPYAQITLVCLRPAVAQLAQQLRIADTIHLLPQKARRSPVAILAAILQMKALNKPNILFQTFTSHGSFGNLMAVASRASIRCGFDDGKFRNALTHRLPLPPPDRHYIQINLDLLRRLGHVSLNVPWNERFLPPIEEGKLSSGSPTPDQVYGRYVVISASSDPKIAFKRWPIDCWARLCNLLAQQGLSSVFIGAPSDSAYIASICQQPGAGINLAGKTDFADMALLFRFARLVVGTDGMPLHFAAAMNRPCVGIFGPTPPAFGGPWGSKHRIVTLNLPCSPCILPALWAK